MEPLARYRQRMRSVRPVHGPAEIETESGRERHLTPDQLLSLVWKVAGATMAAVDVPEDELLAVGHRLASTLHQIVRDYGVTIPDGFRT
jgi:hypothetical protein